MQTQSIQPLQREVKVKGEILMEFPQDLYIPPEALCVILEAFEGPLDLLLYFIKKQNLNILDIPIADITRQYMSYVDLMQELQFELAAEYLVMAAMLAEIKSRLLLPKPSISEEMEEDPRAELVRRLQEYERYKNAALKLDELPRLERDILNAIAFTPPVSTSTAPPPPLLMESLLAALSDVMRRAKLNERHQILIETLSIRERMSFILSKVTAEQFTAFTELFTPAEGRMGVVVTLIAILELTRESLIELMQAHPFAPIYVKGKSTVILDSL